MLWCEHAYHLYSAVPLIRKYGARGAAVEVFTSERYVDLARGFADRQGGEPTVVVRSIDAYKSRWGAWLTARFRRYVTPIDFSPLYYVRLGRDRKRQTALERTVGRLTRARPGDDINARYSRVIRAASRLGLVETLPFEYDLVFAFTKVHHAYALVAYQSCLVAVMESWDHPSKEPYLLRPRRSLTWNDALARETRHFQRYDTVHAILPLKFRYIYEARHASDAELAERVTAAALRADLAALRRGGPYVLYPMCTASIHFGFEGELAFVRDLAAEVAAAGMRLYIRPYPLAPRADAERLAEASPGIHVGPSDDRLDGTEVFDEAATAHKLLVTRGARVVVNTGTTFAFDAALIGAPVVQLYFDEDDGSDFAATINRQTHLKNYLLTERAVAYRPGRLAEALARADRRFADELRDWLLNGRDPETIGAGLRGASHGDDPASASTRSGRAPVPET